MANQMYALDPNYYSRSMGNAAKKKRYLTGRGMTEEEAMSGFYADIAARQAELDAASLRKARQRQLDLEGTKIENQVNQFGQELAYKYAALDKEAALTSSRTDLLRQQLENQEKANMIQGALTLPTALERAYKGGSFLYEKGKGLYNWLYSGSTLGTEGAGGYALPGAAAPEEFIAGGAYGGSDVVSTGTTSAIENFGAMDAGAGLPGMEAPVAGFTQYAAAETPAYLGADAMAEWAAAEGAAYGGASLGSTALSAAGGFAGAVAAPLAVYEAAKFALPAITDAIFGKARHTYEIPTSELLYEFQTEGTPHYQNMAYAGELRNRGMTKEQIGGTEWQWYAYENFPAGGNFPMPEGVDWRSDNWREQLKAWESTNPWINFSFGGAAAEGGPIEGGKAYLVGERGPELVVPKEDSVVIPNHMLGGGGRRQPNMGISNILRGIGGIF